MREIKIAVQNNMAPPKRKKVTEGFIEFSNCSPINTDKTSVNNMCGDAAICQDETNPAKKDISPLLNVSKFK